MLKLDADLLFNSARPIFDATYPFVIILSVLPFSFWIVSKAFLVRNGQEKLQSVICKTFIFMFFLFYWQPFFIGAYFLADAVEAKIIEIDLTHVLPGFETGKDASDMDSAILQMKDEYLLAVDNLRTNGDSVTDKARNFVADVAADLDKAGHIIAPWNYIKDFIAWLASLAKRIVMLIRFALSLFYYVAVPFLFICSYMPVLGDNADMKGLNAYSKSTINWCISIIFWPVIYALLDKVLLLMYYALRSQGAFMDFDLNYTAFFAIYLILYIVLPFTVQKANAFGVMQGTLSTMSTIATMGGMAFSTGANIAGKAGKSGASAAVGSVSSAMSGGKKGLSMPTSNTEAAEGE